MGVGGGDNNFYDATDLCTVLIFLKERTFTMLRISN